MRATQPPVPPRVLHRATAHTRPRTHARAQALSRVLQHQFAGLFMPLLPEKSFIPRLAADNFVKARRADLQVMMMVVNEGGGGL